MRINSFDFCNVFVRHFYVSRLVRSSHFPSNIYRINKQTVCCCFVFFFFFRFDCYLLSKTYKLNDDETIFRVRVAHIRLEHTWHWLRFDSFGRKINVWLRAHLYSSRAFGIYSRSRWNVIFLLFDVQKCSKNWFCNFRYVRSLSRVVRHSTRKKKNFKLHSQCVPSRTLAWKMLENRGKTNQAPFAFHTQMIIYYF